MTCFGLWSQYNWPVSPQLGNILYLFQKKASIYMHQSRWSVPAPLQSLIRPGSLVAYKHQPIRCRHLLPVLSLKYPLLLLFCVFLQVSCIGIASLYIFYLVGQKVFHDTWNRGFSRVKRWNRSKIDVKSWLAITVVIVKLSFFTCEFGKNVVRNRKIVMIFFHLFLAASTWKYIALNCEIGHFWRENVKCLVFSSEKK